MFFACRVGEARQCATRQTAPLWALEIARRDFQLEPTDRSIVAKVVAWLRRVVACKNDRQGLVVGVQRLRIIDSPTEEVRVVAARRSYEWWSRGRRDPRRNLGWRQCVDAGNIHDRRI